MGSAAKQKERIASIRTPRYRGDDAQLRASVGSTEAAEDVVARFGRIDRSNIGSIGFGVVGPKRERGCRFG
jgi:hypothetical protein